MSRRDERGGRNDSENHNLRTDDLPVPYGQGRRMLTLGQLCDWFNITERHARKLVERDAVPYRKVGHLLRFPEAEVEAWSRPVPRPARPEQSEAARPAFIPRQRPRRAARMTLPKSLIE